MGQFIRAQAEDQHQLDVYVAEPEQDAKAGLLVVQEAFGVNHHIQGICESYAKDGYLVAAPALYDRLQKNVQLGYSPDDMTQGIGLMNQLDHAKIFLDIEATMRVLHARGIQNIGMMGFCFGGTVTWRAAHHFKLDAAVCYYGGSIAHYAHEKPGGPVLLHFGEEDPYIPPQDVQKIKDLNPEAECHLYKANHGFNCDERSSFNADCALLARERTKAFLMHHMQGRQSSAS
jgi:carboxymethylenebutenolidase